MLSLTGFTLLETIDKTEESYAVSNRVYPAL